MEGTEFLNGGVNELKTLINDLGNREICMNQVNVCANEGKKLEKELKQEIEELNKDIEKTVNEEQVKATVEEDKLISDGNKRIREVRSERNKAKDRGMKDRIDNETGTLAGENRDLHRLVRKTFKENGLPAYCDTKWFYALYCTQGGIEWLIKIIVFFMAIVGLPGIVVAIADPWWFLKIILWVVVAVLFIIVYMTIYLLSKDKDNGVLEDMRANRYKIADNEKNIRKIKKGIKTDGDESYYNLDGFDRELAELQEKIDAAANARTEKLKDFEENKKQQIIIQVNNNHAGIIENKKIAISKKAEEYQEAINKSNEVAAMIIDNYEQYLTKQFTTRAAAQKMLELIQNGQAENISQAMKILNQ